MNFAEGKGPKQVKTPYTLGQFVTLYSYGDPAQVNPAPVPYPTQLSGAVIGGIVPGLNISVNGNGRTDTGFVSSPNSNSSLQDLESTIVTVMAETGWGGSAVVYVQGSLSRYNNNTAYSASNWVTINSGIVSSANVPVVIPVTGTAYAAYRVIGSGLSTSTSGIIDWIIPEMFTDYSAMGVGSNAGDLNGNLGQMTVQSPKSYTISGGNYVTTTTGNLPLENTKANHTWIG